MFDSQLFSVPRVALSFQGSEHVAAGTNSKACRFTRKVGCCAHILRVLIQCIYCVHKCTEKPFAWGSGLYMSSSHWDMFGSSEHVFALIRRATPIPHMDGCGAEQDQQLYSQQFYFFDAFNVRFSSHQNLNS